MEIDDPLVPVNVTFRTRRRRWRRFAVVARAAGTNRTRVLNGFIDWYTHTPHATRPARPPWPVSWQDEDTVSVDPPR